MIRSEDDELLLEKTDTIDADADIPQTGGHIASIGNGRSNHRWTTKSKNRTIVTMSKPKPEHVAYKYSNRGKGTLHESVIIGGKSFFLNYIRENGEFELVEKIVEENRIIRPPYPEEYPYEPYSFSTFNDILMLAKEVKKATIDSLSNLANASGTFNSSELQNSLVATNLYTYFDLLIRDALEGGLIEKLDGQFETYRLIHK